MDTIPGALAYVGRGIKKIFGNDDKVIGFKPTVIGAQMDIMHPSEQEIDQIEFAAERLDAFLRIHILVFVFQRAGHDHHVDVIWTGVPVDFLLKVSQVINDQDILTYHHHEED